MARSWLVGANERTVVGRRDALLGEVFDRRFRIEARIASGGFGAIYRATHIKSGHPLALKVLHASLTHDDGVVARFRREGAALTRLRDPHTITAYELGETPDGTFYIVMELLRGESLYERFRAHGPLPWRRTLAIGRAVCSSLAEAHALGIIHRDLKPTNIHLEPRGGDRDFVKVLDFGIAKILSDGDIDNSELTHAGQMIGTLDYMSPEQMVGGMCDAASDIYALGVVMYEMIAGAKPFDEANSAAAALAAVLTSTAPRLAVKAVVPPEVDRVVMRCLERQHTDRYASAAELASELDALLSVGDEVVTTVDLTHPRAGVTTIKGMRMPARPPQVSIAAARPVASAAGSAATGKAASTATGDPGRRPAAAPDELPTRIAAVGPALASLEAAARAEAGPAPRPAGALAGMATPPAPPAAAAAAMPGSALPAIALASPAPASSAPAPPPAGQDVVRVGSMGLPRAPGPRPPAATPHAGVSQIPKNLREAYPTIHRLPPSPMRPQSTMGDGGPGSAGIGVAFDMSRVVRRNALVRRLAIGLGLAIAIIVALLIAAR